MRSSGRRCPPGVICLENITVMFICIILLIVGGGIYLCRPKQQTHMFNGSGHMFNGPAQHMFQAQQQQGPAQQHIYMEQPAKKGTGNDVFFDLYKAPLRDDRCFNQGTRDVRGSVPINVSTQSCDEAPYRQIGILTRYGGKDETILPLMGRPLFLRRDKWNFYTLNDKNNMIKLPVKVKGKSGTSEVGCDNVYSGDIVFVEGYNDAFKVTTYDNDIVRYLPSL
jgi:hypothetical protein